MENYAADYTIAKEKLGNIELIFGTILLLIWSEIMKSLLSGVNLI